MANLTHKILEGKIYYLTFTVVDWVDVFTRPLYKHIIIDAFQFAQKSKGLILYAQCIMSNHIHLIAEATEGHHLSDIIRDFKKHTNKEIIQAIKENPESRRDWMLNRFEFAGRYRSKIKDYKFWQDGNEAKEIYSAEFLFQKLNYIHNNPVIAEYVEQPEHYKYSSAIDSELLTCNC